MPVSNALRYDFILELVILMWVKKPGGNFRFMEAGRGALWFLCREGGFHIINNQ